jgi:1,4-dihydroxy-2-naphthoate octaprenyltransferase
MTGLDRARAVQAASLLATIVFFVLGFAVHGWAWAWIVFLVVPLVTVLTRPSGEASRERDRRP